MRSNGGKISFTCPSCGSAHIVNTKKGLGIQGAKSYVNVPANNYLCIDCGAHNKWSARIKVKDPQGLDGFDGEVTLAVYQQLVEKVDSIHHFVKRTIVVSKAEKKFDKPPKAPKRFKRAAGSVTELGIRWSPDSQEDCSHWTHRPYDFGIWVPYNVWRFKDMYDVMDRHGKIYRKCYPNGNAFHHDGGDVYDDDVIALRLCTYEDLKDNWRAGGDNEEDSNRYRAERNADMFAYNKPEDWDCFEPLELDPETMELKKPLEEWAGDCRVGEAPVDMKYAHRVFDEECGLGYISMTNMRCDEQLLAENIPGYQIDEAFLPDGVSLVDGKIETTKTTLDEHGIIVETFDEKDVGRGLKEPEFTCDMSSFAEQGILPTYSDVMGFGHKSAPIKTETVSEEGISQDVAHMMGIPSELLEEGESSMTTVVEEQQGSVKNFFEGWRENVEDEK